MRIVVSDYSGHPFQVELSRELARRGHDVLHLSTSSFQTPKGRLDAADTDPPTFASVAVSLDKPFRKDSFVHRRPQEIEIGRLIGAHIATFAPDVVISANAPLDTQRGIQRAARAAGARFVFWVQDLYGDAIARILRDRLGLPGRAIGTIYQRMEARMLRRSDHAVVIADAFVDTVRARGRLRPDQVTIIQNWAPLAELPVMPRDNDWACANLPATPLRLIYTGTLGLKHDPDRIAAIARALPIEVLVFSEGAGANALAATAAREGLANLSVRPWVPFAKLPAALAGADLLLVILEPEAGAFSVPSKVLTYLCAGRPVVASMPRDNLAARLIERAGAGVVTAPDDASALIDAVRVLATDAGRRAAMGLAARAHAERHFAIGPIADRFERICNDIKDTGAKAA